jgi:peptidoglycan-associated lipoprotein
MISLLLLAFAVGGQGEPLAPAGPRERFIICPGNERCPPRPQQATGAGAGVVLGAVMGGVGSAPRAGPRLDFAPGEAALTPVSREKIEVLARQMIANPRLDALVEGHADLRGTGAASVALAGRRASAAAAYLIERGVAADRITTISWGNAGAETHADDRDAGARNRSVVISLRRNARPRP